MQDCFNADYSSLKQEMSRQKKRPIYLELKYFEVIDKLAKKNKWPRSEALKEIIEHYEVWTESMPDPDEIDIGSSGD